MLWERIMGQTKDIFHSSVPVPLVCTYLV